MTSPDPDAGTRQRMANGASELIDNLFDEKQQKEDSRKMSGVLPSQASSSIPSVRLMAFGFLTSVLSLATYGIQDVVLNVPEHDLERYINNSYKLQYDGVMPGGVMSAVWGAVVSMFPIGAIIGAMAAMTLNDRFGRRMSLFGISNVCVLLGSAAMFVAYYENIFQLLLLGRLTLGFATGIQTVTLPIYLVECSPLHVRGFMAGLHGVCCYLLHGVCFVLSLPQLLGAEANIGYLLASQFVPAVIQLLLMPFAPESPQYVFQKSNDVDRAEAIYRRLWASEDRVDEMVALVLERAKLEKKMAQVKLSFRDIWDVPAIRKAIMLACCVGGLRNLVGVAAVHAYSTDMFITAGVPENVAAHSSLLIGGGGFIFCVVSVLIVERVGRRPLLLSCIAFVNITWIVVLVLEYIDQTRAVSVSSLTLLLFAFVVVYPLGPGTIIWYLAAELVPEIARATTEGFSITTLWFTYLLSVFLYPVLMHSLGPLAILILFILPTSIIWIIVCAWLPETKQRPTVEVMEELGGPEWDDGLKDKLKLSDTDLYDDKDAYGALAMKQAR